MASQMEFMCRNPGCTVKAGKRFDILEHQKSCQSKKIFHCRNKCGISSTNLRSIQAHQSNCHMASTQTEIKSPSAALPILVNRCVNSKNGCAVSDTEDKLLIHLVTDCGFHKCIKCGVLCDINAFREHAVNGCVTSNTTSQTVTSDVSIQIDKGNTHETLTRHTVTEQPQPSGKPLLDIVYMRDQPRVLIQKAIDDLHSPVSTAVAIAGNQRESPSIKTADETVYACTHCGQMLNIIERPYHDDICSATTCACGAKTTDDVNHERVCIENARLRFAAIEAIFGHEFIRKLVHKFNATLHQTTANGRDGYTICRLKRYEIHDGDRMMVVKMCGIFDMMMATIMESCDFA